MLNNNHILLRTAADIAFERAQETRELWERREKTRKEQEAKAAWQSRLTTGGYTCRPYGTGWLAECPSAGQLFQFARHPSGEVECVSHTGHTYWLRETGCGLACSCPATDPCKHSAAWLACQQEARHRDLAKVQPPAVLSPEVRARMEAARREVAEMMG